MWKLLLEVVSQRKARRSWKTGESEDGIESALRPVIAFERIGTNLRLVNRLIRDDRASSGRPMVLRNDREVAVQLLINLVADSKERSAYERYLAIVMPQTNHNNVPDDLTVQFILDRRWSQLSSSFLGEFLLNPTAIRYVARKLMDTQPGTWFELTDERRGENKPTKRKA
ncbi:MAG: hypothetical protein IT428_29660 [Planctomycetaceae bacterium]|nr:hypothetical protein [Planctomycetaceae bacterium]